MRLSKLTFIFKYFDFGKITTTFLAKVSEKPWETRSCTKQESERKQGREVKGLYPTLFISKLLSKMAFLEEK